MKTSDMCDILKAASNDVRLELLNILAEAGRPMRLYEVAAEVAARKPLNNPSAWAFDQLKKLAMVNLVKRTGSGQAAVYELNPGPILAVAEIIIARFSPRCVIHAIDDALLDVLNDLRPGKVIRLPDGAMDSFE